MKQVLKISLAEIVLDLEQDAYEALGSYLGQAKSRLHGNPDQAEIIADLERSIAEKLAETTTSPARPVNRERIVSILQEIGAVEAGDIGPITLSNGPSPKPRHLYRIKARQQLAGVCAGVAEYSDLDVGWVRTIFILLTVFTGGAFGLVYLVMMFLLPVADPSTEFKLAPAK